MKRLDELLPPEFWDEVFKPRGPAGLFSGRTALGFLPGVSQGLDAVDAKQMIEEDDKLGLGLMAGSYLLGPLARVGRKAGRELIAGPRAAEYDPAKGTRAVREAKLNPAEARTAEGKVKHALRNEGYWTEPDALDQARKGRIPVFEISDAKFRMKSLGNSLNTGKEVPLTYVVEHPELFKNYPQLKNYKVVFQPSLEGDVAGWVDTNKKLITLSKKSGTAHMPHTMLHEIQHAIASMEDLSPGFQNWNTFRTNAMKAGISEDEANKIFLRMHAKDYGENLADLPADKWKRIDRAVRSAIKKGTPTDNEWQKYYADKIADNGFYTPAEKASISAAPYEFLDPQDVLLYTRYEPLYNRLHKSNPVTRYTSKPRAEYPEIRDFTEEGKNFNYGDHELWYDTLIQEHTIPQSYDDLTKEVLDRPGERERVRKISEQMLEELRNAKD